MRTPQMQHPWYTTKDPTHDRPVSTLRDLTATQAAAALAQAASQGFAGSRTIQQSDQPDLYTVHVWQLTLEDCE